MSTDESRRLSLEAAGLLHPRPEAVTCLLFRQGGPFFFAADKVQVKYEMLRAHLVDGDTITDAAASHGYSRAEFYLVAAAFERSGMSGLLDERRGRKGPSKLTAEVRDFIEALGPCSATEAAAAVQDDFGVSLSVRSVQRVRRR